MVPRAQAWSNPRRPQPSEFMLRTLLLFALVFPGLMACASGARAEVFSMEGVWQVVELDGRACELPGPEIEFGAERVSGSTGVNRFSGEVRTEQGLFFGPLVTTRMAGAPRAMEVERDFLAALARVDGWKSGGDALELLEGDHPLMRLVRP